ncbi:MAG: Glu/Leu/Phe/Val dehydrogenase dimerization domain-containing protein [Bacteroidota bacterium]|nr:Glu/Leu/Phe/Val dehydrogenase dimerization domain-containing protein [Bacteroidota bacterium]MDP4232959.1 Glu/Leu/Phe/Val dehydrogenase dimerization domain-containing protein [Bacteroidota bacterium]MDP4242003.1 Glu/Leu/Phe/Val dehydrogenase dimerization domain-containing protein [Bacteroidota bacterium]MDP4286906.1 Glu/Leu/Phe/Val dehydrogenase dimerization domain-containing protein [Bacteroidota bacterium]
MAELLTPKSKISVAPNGLGKNGDSQVVAAITTPGTVSYERSDEFKGLFDLLGKRDHEQVVFCHDQRSGLKAIIGIHNTTLGPALGGTRMWTYASDFDALRDVLRLSRGMTYKAAVAGLNLGGGKAVIIGDPRKDKTEQMFRAFGRYVEGLGGRYITAEDVGTSLTEMVWIRSETKYVTGIPVELGGSGDPSPVTARGTYVGIKACASVKFGNDSLAGKHIVIQGAGHVAQYLAKYCVDEGAKVSITDIYADKANAVAKETGATVVSPESIYDIPCDIFAPAALGAILNDDTIPKLKCAIVAGPANNQLAHEEEHAQALKDRGILFAPDYVINAGGLINVANELEGYSQPRALKQAEGIYDVLKRVLILARDKDITTMEASNQVAEDRLRAIGGTKRIYASKSEFSGRFGESWQR